MKKYLPELEIAIIEDELLWREWQEVLVLARQNMRRVVELGGGDDQILKLLEIEAKCLKGIKKCESRIRKLKALKK